MGHRGSPQQIAKRLLREFPDDVSMRISHEAIYRALYVPDRGGLTRQQSWHLRRGRTKRMPPALTSPLQRQRSGSMLV
jgi:IS30 family transposase